MTVHLKKVVAATILDCLIRGAFVVPNMLSLVVESNPAAQWHR